MINLIQTEFSKLKRQKTIFIITGVLLLFWAGMTFWNYHVPQKSFEDFYIKYSSYLAMLLPFLLGLLFIKTSASFMFTYSSRLSFRTL